MNKKNKILSSAKKAYMKLGSIKTLNSTFNNFYKAVDAIHHTKGRVILTGKEKVHILVIKYQQH